MHINMTTSPENAMKQQVDESTADSSMSVPTCRPKAQGGAASAASLRWSPANGVFERSSATIPNTWDVLGVDVQAWEQTQAVAVLDARVNKSKPTCIAFANTNLLNIAVSNPALRSSLKTFIVFNDGIGMNFAARILYGKAFPSNLNGTDFIPFYLNNTVHCHRIFLIGARPEIVERAAGAFQQRFASRHEIVGYTDGFSSLADVDAVLGKIVASKADLLLVGMGNPKQELWIADHMAKSGSRLAFGVGALLDFTAGEFKRAPRFVQHMNLEWLYRLWKEPRRLFKRYILDTPVFLLRVLRQRILRPPL